MRIEVLGPIRLSTEAGAPVEVPEHKVRLLLAALVSADGEAVPADALIDRVWGDSLPTHPERVLRAKLSGLRAALDRAEPGMRARLRHGPGGYTLIVNHGMVDAELFTHQVAEARRMTSAADRSATLAEALALWHGAAYADLANELWLGPVVESLHEARLSAVELRAESLLESGDPAHALEVVHAELAEHPLRERLVGARIVALYQLGRQGESLQAYESLRHELADELGVDPTPALRELHARILRHDPALTPQARQNSARGNLPAATTSLIGRGIETRRVAGLLVENRLVTLTGVGGVGKTRLALHVAQAVADRFDRGAWCIDLSQLSAGGPDPERDADERVAQLVLAGLGLPGEGTLGAAMDKLARSLEQRAGLLVLDNAEHVIAEVSTFTGELLRRAPGVRVLATSRQAFGLAEEQRFEVGAFSTDADHGELSEAATFFTARARTADPGFDPAATGVQDVEELCRRLDGLPLALELAASRVHGLSVADLLARLTDRLTLLTRPGHGAPRRQQTLRGMIDWSWSLLDEREHAVLRRLAIHPGSWNLSAIEAICADDPSDAEHTVTVCDVVDVLIGLVDRSMVATVSTPSGGLRYRLLESIGLYAAERLADAGERDRIADRHLSYFRTLAVDEDVRLRGPEQQAALARLEDEHAHVDRAFDEALARADGQSAVAIAVGVFWYRWITGRHSRLLEDLAAATACAGPRDSGYATAVILSTSLRLAEHPGREEAALRSALALFGSDDLARARVQWFAATSLMAAGGRQAGEDLAAEAISILHDAKDRWHVVAATCERNWFLVTQWAKAPRSLPDGRDPVDEARELGDRYVEAQAVGVCQRVAENTAQHELAAQLAEDALRICQELGFHSEGAWWAVCTAIGAIRRGEIEDAWARLATARTMAAEVGDRYSSAYADHAEGVLTASHGDPERARSRLEGLDDPWQPYFPTTTPTVG